MMTPFNSTATEPKFLVSATGEKPASDDLAENNCADHTASTETAPVNFAEDEKKRWYCSPRLHIGLLLVGFIVYVIVDSFTTGYSKDAVNSFLDWVSANPVGGFFVFVIGKLYLANAPLLRFFFPQAFHLTNQSIWLIFALSVYWAATVFFVPGSLLTLGAGFVFSNAFGLGAGVVLGIVSVFVGASLGAVSAFLLARYLLREQVGRLSKRYAVFEALDLALQDNGLKIFVLLRLSPLIPFNAINYIGGVSSVSLRDYVIALVAILPGTTLYVFLGASAGSLADSANSGSDPTVTIVVVLVGVVFGVLAVWLTTRYARRELNRVLQERRAEAEPESADVEAPLTIDTASAADGVNAAQQNLAMSTRTAVDGESLELDRKVVRELRA